jgi:hypothetical protein
VAVHTPAQRSEAAQRKASTQRLHDGTPVHDLHTLLGHLGSLTRNRMALARAPEAPTFEVTSEPTPLQARALTVLGLTPTTL